jgi:hypothetical protein
MIKVGKKVNCDEYFNTGGTIVVTPKKSIPHFLTRCLQQNTINIAACQDVGENKHALMPI